MSRIIKIGILLRPKDRDHLGIPSFETDFTIGKYHFKAINEENSISSQGPFDVIIHKASDYIKSSRQGNGNSERIIKELLDYDKICIDNPRTVLELADRSKMFNLMDRFKFEHNSISVDVPQWTTIRTQQDLNILKSDRFKYPLICKALCAGEGPGGHSMQLVFNPDQLGSLDVFPCIAQEFKNHNGFMVKIFVFGPEHYICTRPSVRNFPINGLPLQKHDTLKFDSHDVAKMSSKSFLNNYQQDFVLRNSNSDPNILDSSVVKILLSLISKHIESNLLGIDIIITENGRFYNLVDINYLPSFEGVTNRFQILHRMVKDYIEAGGHVIY